ncbi:MAG: NusG domain II-containing protein [Coriobacteriia bacterium]|nr:NusG domain II-containing protein [Coriobacteriia bacterium]
MTRGDRLLIGVLVVAALVAWPLASAVAHGTAEEVIISGPEGSSVVSLHEDAEFDVEGRLGSVTVRIVDGQVSVADSCCCDQVCVRTGSVSAAGSVIACVPNGVVIRLGGGDHDGLDARIR